jgi:hypothetical protein
MGADINANTCTNDEGFRLFSGNGYLAGGALFSINGYLAGIFKPCRNNNNC